MVEKKATKPEKKMDEKPAETGKKKLAKSKFEVISGSKLMSKLPDEKPKPKPEKKKSEFAPIIEDLGDGRISTTYPRRTKIIVRQKK